MKFDYFLADLTSFKLVANDVGIGKIYELSSQDASLLLPHIGSHPETLYVACSGVDISGSNGTLQAGSRGIAIEWAREETKPTANEPELNIYRYLFGVTADGRCLGCQEWEFVSTSDNQQVGDHWMDLNDFCKRFTP